MLNRDLQANEVFPELFERPYRNNFCLFSIEQIIVHWCKLSLGNDLCLLKINLEKKREKKEKNFVTKKNIKMRRNFHRNIDSNSDWFITHLFVMIINISEKNYFGDQSDRE